jgi:uncharacterized protein (TIGR02145 family)
MKKLITIIAIVLSMTTMAQQPFVGLGANEARQVGEDVLVPILVANMPKIGAISLGIEFSPQSVTFVSGSSAVVPALIFYVEPTVPGKLMIGGYPPPGQPLTIPDGVLGWAIFKYNKFETELKWMPASCEFADSAGKPIPNVTYFSGSLFPVVDIAGKTWMARNANFGVKLNTIQHQTNNGIVERHAHNDSVYGSYYKWDEAMQYSTQPGAQGVCPSGWHLPTIAEWASLVTAYLGPNETFNYFPLTTYNTAAKCLKASNSPTYVWAANPGNGTSGFNAIGGGWYLPGVAAKAATSRTPAKPATSGYFSGGNVSGLYWTSELIAFKDFDPVRYSKTPGSDPVVFQFYTSDQSVRIITLRRSDNHVSVRCVKN